MARRIDPIGPSKRVKGGRVQPFESPLLSALVRVVTHWTALETHAAVASAAGLTIDPADVPALFALGLSGPVRPSLLAQKLRVSPPTVSRTVARLVDGGLVHRVADPDDARASMITLTVEGVAAARRLFEQGDKMMARLLEGWDADEVAVFTSLLERFADRVDKP
jgi:DNA-binding MarR family transcriptional regulator